jgi:hypothetical protein
VDGIGDRSCILYESVYAIQDIVPLYLTAADLLGGLELHFAPDSPAGAAPRQMVPAQGRIVVANKRFGAGVARLCRQHGAHAGRI